MKNVTMNILAVIGSAMVLSACAQPQGNDRLQEKAGIEADTNQNAIDKKAQEMERGLARQQRFFQGLAGTYEGLYKSENGTLFNVSFVLTPTIPVYSGDRIRNGDEITYDLTNLAFSIEERMWKKDPDGTDFSVGHNYEKIKPLTDSGYLYVNEDNYPISFVVSPLGAQSQVITDKSTLELIRRKIAKDLLEGNLVSVEYLQVDMRSTNITYTSSFLVRRKK